MFLIPSTRTISCDIAEILIFLQSVVSEISIWQIVVLSLVIKSDVFKDEYIVSFDGKCTGNSFRVSSFFLGDRQDSNI